MKQTVEILEVSPRDGLQNEKTILSTLEIPREWLPRIYEGPQVTGQLRAEVAVSLGLPAGLLVVAGGGDNAAAAIGTGIIREGVISASIGTSGVLFAHSCVAHPGTSGSPLVVAVDAGSVTVPTLIAIHIGTEMRWQGTKLDFVSVAHPIDAEVAGAIEAAARRIAVLASNERRRLAR